MIDEGWIDQKRVHALIFDAEIRNHKIWLHHNGLDHGIIDDLVVAGVPKWNQKLQPERDLRGCEFGKCRMR